MPPISVGLRRQMFLLALPVLGEQLLTFCIDLFDVYLSGQIGKSETAAVGLAGYITWLASMIFSLVGVGTTAIIAREWGAARFDDARRVAGRSLAMVPIIGLLVFSLLQLMATVFPRLLTMEGNQQQIAVTFLRIDACGELFRGWTLISAACFRGTGDMLTPLKVLVTTNLINMCLSTMLVWGCNWPGTTIPLIAPQGVIGIVIGTTTAHVSGALLMASLVVSRRSRLHLTLRDFQLHRPTICRVLRIGGPAALGGLCTFIGHFSFLMVIARLSKGFDGAVMAAHVVGVRIESLSYLPVEAFGIAAATMVGQSLGAHQIERAKQAGHEAIRQCLWYAGMMSILFFCFAPQIYQRMHSDPLVAQIGVPAFRLMSLYQIPNAILIVYVNALRGAGDTRFPLGCALLGNILIRVSVGYFCGVYLQLGLMGAWIGMGADNIVRSILVSWRYLGGRWTRTTV